MSKSKVSKEKIVIKGSDYDFVVIPNRRSGKEKIAVTMIALFCFIQFC